MEMEVHKNLSHRVVINRLGIIAGALSCSIFAVVVEGIDTDQAMLLAEPTASPIHLPVPIHARHHCASVGSQVLATERKVNSLLIDWGHWGHEFQACGGDELVD